MTIIPAIFLFLISACFWAGICNSRTCSQRMAIIDRVGDAIRASGYTIDYWPSFHSVSYERHLWLLMTFRNPIKHYVGLPEVA